MSDDEKTTKLTMRDIAFRGTIIAIFITVLSFIAFFLVWIIFDDLVLAAFSGGIVYLVALVFSWKISKKLLVKK